MKDGSSLLITTRKSVFGARFVHSEHPHSREIRSAPRAAADGDSRHTKNPTIIDRGAFDLRRMPRELMGARNPTGYTSRLRCKDFVLHEALRGQPSCV